MRVLKLYIDVPGHPFNGCEAMITHGGYLDWGYYHRVGSNLPQRPVPVIILARARSAVQLMDIFDASELVIR